MDDELVAAVEYENDGFEHPCSSVESQSQLAPGRTIAERLHVLRPRRRVKGVFVTDA
jgi:hypothetical protein